MKIFFKQGGNKELLIVISLKHCSHLHITACITSNFKYIGYIYIYIYTYIADIFFYLHISIESANVVPLLLLRLFNLLQVQIKSSRPLFDKNI